MKEVKARSSPVVLIVMSSLLSLGLFTACNLTSHLTTNDSVDDKEIFKPVVLENNPNMGFGVKSAEVSQNIKGTVFVMDKINKGKSKTLDASGFRSNIDYNTIIACEKPCTVKVFKNKSGLSYYYDDGTRILRGERFLLSGFKNPDFKGVKFEIVSKTDNNRVTAGIFQDAKISAGSYLSSNDENKLYGVAGNNVEVFDLPTTLMYLGKTPVNRGSFNKKAFPKIGLLLASFNATGSFNNNNSYSGGYNKRYIAGTNILSNHSWGSAIDLLTNNSNGSTLTYNQTENLVPNEMKDIASRLGIAWGGFWKKSFDPMHWEVINKDF